MKEKYISQALRHLAKSMYVGILTLFMFFTFLLSMGSGFKKLAFIILVISAIMTAITFIQITEFIKTIFRANKDE